MICLSSIVNTMAADVSVHYSDVILGVMASQITSLTNVYSTVYSGVDQRKHQSSASLAFVRGIHRWPVNSPHKWPVMRKMFPFNDVIMNTMRQGINRYDIAIVLPEYSSFNSRWVYIGYSDVLYLYGSLMVTIHINCWSNDGNNSGVDAGRGEHNDLRLCYIIHIWTFSCCLFVYFWVFFGLLCWVCFFNFIWFFFFFFFFFFFWGGGWGVFLVQPRHHLK